MAQIRRQPHYRSPPPRQIPSLPNPVRIPLSTRNRIPRMPPLLPQNIPHIIETNQLLPIHPTEQLRVLPSLNNDNEEFFEKRHLPVYAQFPFDVSLLPQPMETNIEDNVHKLRLRLIDSELNHQRRSTNEYIKRTHRIGMENDLPNSSDIERDLETRRVDESLNQRRRLNPPSNYSYDPRLHLKPVDEEQVYVSSNMDDLIDSMARRHLASRRFDAAIDRQRRNNEGWNTDRSLYRNEDLLNTNRSSRNLADRDPRTFNQRLRSRIDYYNRIQPDVDDSMPTNSFKRLPPISPGQDSHRANHFKDSSRSSFYENKNHGNSFEHVIDLPRDVPFSPQIKMNNSSQRNRRIQPRSISKDTRSDEELEVPMTTRHKMSSEDDYDGFFTENSGPQKKKKSKIRRNLFRKAAIGILFFTTLKHRSLQNRSNRSKSSSSATIHKLRLQEMIVALHRVYLEPDGPIFNALIQAISSPISLDNALNKSSKNYSEAIKIIGNALKNIILKTVEFMPKDGVLGTTKTSAISALIQEGNLFPENYFWECERKLLEFDDLKIIKITKQRAILLLIGVFIFRALITTLLLKPIKYRLILGQLKPNQAVSLKVLTSALLYIGRRVAGPKSQILSLPHEWQGSLYTDADMQAILQHPDIKSIINTCEQSLRNWCEEYIRRIDENFDRKLR